MQKLFPGKRVTATRVCLLLAAFLVAVMALSRSGTAYAALTTGELTICKVAGSGVTAGTNFSFNAGGTSVTVPAGGCTVAGQFTQGTNVTVAEAAVSGTEVSAISVSQSAVLFSSNLATRTAVVTIGGFHNTVSFTNRAVVTVCDGCLTICKIAGGGVTNGTNFSFTATAGALSVTLSVPAGSCKVTGIFPNGVNITVQETVPSGMHVSAISKGDNLILVSTNLAGGSAVVQLGATNHNTVTFTNEANVRGCTLTQGFYKNHPEALPATMKLGTISYTRAQLITILETPVKGNGAIALAHQLIAAQANIVNGASAPAAVLTAIKQANTLLDSLNLLAGGFLDPSLTSALTDILDQYNNGLATGGPPHCD